MEIARRKLLLALGVAGLAAGCSTTRSEQTSSPPASPSLLSRPRSSPSPGPSTAAAQPRRAAPPGPAREIASGPSQRNEVALTFHVAGDPQVVRDVLTAVHHARVKVTMLVVGQWLAQNPSFAKEILAGGHDLGNHTWSHPVLASDDPHQTRLEVLRCRDLLIRLTGSGGRWFRPSGIPHATPLMLRAAGAAGYPTSLSYSVDPLDYTDPGSAAVVSRVLADSRAGSIVSLHTLYAGTPAALPAVISGLRARGLEPVAASTLLPHAHEGMTA